MANADPIPQPLRRYRPCASTFAVTLLGGALALALPGCDREEPAPTEQLQQGLDQASEAIDDLRDQSSAKQDQLQEMQKDLEATAQKQINLMQAQLDDFRQRITRLPAEREQEFTARLGELENRARVVAQELTAYTHDTQGTGDWQAIKQTLDELKSNFDTFASELNDAVPR